MADFADCYFCGAVADDLTQHPVIPPETDPPDDRQRRVVVCPTCREKLDRVVDPVVAHFEARLDRAGASPPGSDPQVPADDPADAGDDAREEDATEGDTGDDPDDAPIDEAPDEDEEDTGGEPGTDGEERTTEDDPGIDEPEGATDDAAKAADARTETGDEPEEAVDLPAETRKILQLLGNREFPVDRGEIVAVATNAYGVETDEAEAVVDALIERGRLVEKEGTLYRPE